MNTSQIAETEWPLFGSAFYLWATEALQLEWEKDPSLSKQAPKVYAREAIDASLVLILDPGHATWVKDHWGESYMERENTFYRMLVISAIVSHHNLTGERKYFALLREQATSLAQEIDASDTGLTDDYPGQCYPADVVAAIGAIQRVDKLLGTDHSAMIHRSLRAFTGKMAEPYGLPPYAADAETGRRFDDSRGCGNSYFATFAPAIWPEQNPGWYQSYADHYWQQNWFAAGFREFPHEVGDEYYFDVDAGPVFGGFGTAATAFGAGAARTNGRFDHASTLSYEMIAASWPLPDGTLLFPRLFSNGDHAPMLGEAAILFQLSRQAVDPTQAVNERGPIPACVWLMLLGYAFLAWITCRPAWRLLRGRKKSTKR
ncbi:hypothetical protein JO972_03370 [Verrucomicrobiaceae bacterium 5K15]|uniref:Uncharacterized protein n=1 Tax=Oceaniferula flava TaxID=2800421 RepID=A0AAE2S9Q8_9BACT|nr:hypothetical protein [Oceaniferula flavus]MBK1853985.1 hypothetical protein [Oceaniferula flavus]MBM1135291.1 hypothetical protein [Oceaniferula flavus]